MIPVFRHDPKRNRAFRRIKIAECVIEKIFPVVITESIAFLPRSGMHPQHEVPLEIQRFPIPGRIICRSFEIIIIHGKKKPLVTVLGGNGRNYRRKQNDRQAKTAVTDLHDLPRFLRCPIGFSSWIPARRKVPCPSRGVSAAHFFPHCPKPSAHSPSGCGGTLFLY